MFSESVDKAYDTLAQFVRDRRHSFGFSQREVCELIRTYGIEKMGYGGYGRIECGDWVPKDQELLRSIARALKADEEEVIKLAERSRQGLQVLNRDYSHLLQLLKAMVVVMNKEQRISTIQALNQKIGLYKEPIHELARNFFELWQGNLKLDEAPRNGLRPLIYYLRPFCDEDLKPWDSDAQRDQSDNGMQMDCLARKTT